MQTQFFSQKIAYNVNRIDVKLKILKVIIRLCFDIRAINQNKYIILQEKILEIGRMLGGWIKDTRSPR